MSLADQLKKLAKVRESLYSQNGWCSENVDQSSKWDVGDMATDCPPNSWDGKDTGTNLWSNPAQPSQQFNQWPNHAPNAMTTATTTTATTSPPMRISPPPVIVNNWQGSINSSGGAIPKLTKPKPQRAESPSIADNIQMRLQNMSLGTGFDTGNGFDTRPTYQSPYVPPSPHQPNFYYLPDLRMPMQPHPMQPDPNAGSYDLMAPLLTGGRSPYMDPYQPPNPYNNGW